MKKLNEGALKVGDIILTTSTEVVSKVIRMRTKSDISHAMVYVEAYSVIDATAEGVQSRNTQRLMYDDEVAVYALRLRQALTPDQAVGICSFVRSKVGTQYTTKEAIRTAFGGQKTPSKKQFCSRLVAQAYASVGIKLVDNPDFCSPGNLRDSPLLESVVDATQPISADDVARWGDRVDMPQMMRDATNAILNGARTKDSGIQDFSDLDRYVIDHPEDDEFICGLYESSGYLTLWAVETNKNPWQYDLQLMTEFASSGAAIREYCESLLSGEGSAPNRFQINRGGYVAYSEAYDRRTFRRLLELYERLADLHRVRVNTAKAWLTANHFLAPGSVADSYFVPHTPEWFAALRVWNPVQAEMTKTVIEATGRYDVCSICGDDPARDYRLQVDYRAAGGVDTLKLCDDCLDTRRAMNEPYIALSRFD